MPRSFDLGTTLGFGGKQFRLRVTGAILALLNGIALFFYLDPPGGSRAALELQDQQLRTQIAAVRTTGARVKLIASRVQVGSQQSAGFEERYFLPERTAYLTVLQEIQRMAKESGLQERDANYRKEPIEGTADLSLLNITANYQGPYTNLMKFLYQSDHSPMLLMLDALTASPQQKDGQISTAIRFQVIVRDLPVAFPAGTPPGGQN